MTNFPGCTAECMNVYVVLCCRRLCFRHALKAHRAVQVIKDCRARRAARRRRACRCAGTSTRSRARSRTPRSASARGSRPTAPSPTARPATRSPPLPPPPHLCPSPQLQERTRTRSSCGVVLVRRAGVWFREFKFRRVKKREITIAPRGAVTGRRTRGRRL